MWNLVARTKGATQAEGFREYKAGEYIWAYEGQGNSAVEQTTQEALCSVLLTKHSGDQIKNN
jgi:hypothetical protein